MNDGRKTPHSGCMAIAGLPNGAESTVSEPNMGNKKGQSLGFSRTAVQINSGSRQCLQAGTKKHCVLHTCCHCMEKMSAPGGSCKARGREGANLAAAVLCYTACFYFISVGRRHPPHLHAPGNVAQEVRQETCGLKGEGYCARGRPNISAASAAAEVSQC